MDRIFDWIQLAAVGGVLCLGVGRAAALYARGVRVVVIDPQRPLGQALRDLLAVLCALVWAYESVAFAWPLQTHLAPAALRVVLVDAVAWKLAGAALLLAGLAVYGLALWSFGASWRLGIDRDAHGALVTGGLFAHTRNPVYLSFDLLAAGAFLVQGRLVLLVLALAVAALCHDLILREERFLEETYGDAYRSYCARVPRYLGLRA